MAWPIVCAPRDVGGLGLPGLSILRFALRLRWEWLRRTRPDSPWALMPPLKEHVVASMFRASVTVELGDGTSATFWTDAWLSTGEIKSFAPNLFKAVGRRNLQRTVRDALSQPRWVRDITGARMAPVLLEYVRLWTMVRDVQLQPLQADRFVWRWTADGQYTARSAYRAFFAGWRTMAGAKELWHAPAPPKAKFFFWTALHGRLWTADRRKRHSLQQSVACALCDQLDETTDHLLCACVLTREVWHRTLLLLHIPVTPPQHDDKLLDRWLSARTGLPELLRRSFDSLVILLSWCIWKERNRRVFDARSRTLVQLLHYIREEGHAWTGAGFKALSLLLAMVP